MRALQSRWFPGLPAIGGFVNPFAIGAHQQMVAVSGIEAEATAGWQIGVLPFATFILVNYLFYRYRVFGAMDAADSPPGTVYFAVGDVAGMAAQGKGDTFERFGDVARRVAAITALPR